MIRGLSLDRGWEFFFTTTSRPSLGPSQPPLQWILGAVAPWDIVLGQ